MTSLALPSSLSLAGRTALVTGAGSASGIGLATARALGELGASVVITGTTERIHARAAELANEGIEVRAIEARLEHAEGADRLREALAAHSLEPDILVNNAGMVATGDDGMLAGDALMDPVEWEATIALNLSSAYLVTRIVLPGMRARGWGRIVSVSSVSGAVMATRGDVAYATAKAGMLGFTRAVAVDEASKGITVNAVAPGWIATGSQLASEALEGERVPMRRSGTAREVASAIAWLATPGASYVTGQLVVVDGGNAVAEERV